jgi:hypothetical protein
VEVLLTAGASLWPDMNREVASSGDQENRAPRDARGLPIPPSPIDLIRGEFLQKKILRLARSVREPTSEHSNTAV